MTARRKPQTFEQAAFGFVCEFSGSQPNVSIAGEPFVQAVCVCLRDKRLPNEAQGQPYGYQLTLFQQSGDWQQLEFDLRGNVNVHHVGVAPMRPLISKQQETL